MRVFYISEVQWRSQISRKHQIVRRLPPDWDIVFVSPMNMRAGENSFRLREDRDHPNVRFVSLPLPKPDSALALIRSLTGLLTRTGTRHILSDVASFSPDIAVCSYIWAAPAVSQVKSRGCPVVYDCNDLHPAFYPARRNEAEAMFRSLVNEATEVVCSSSYLRDICGRGRLIGNGVDLELFHRRTDVPLPAAIAESRLAACEHLVMYVGSVDDRVDFGIVSELVRALAGRQPRTGLVCLGRIFEGAESAVKALTERHPENVLFTGRVPYEQLPRYMSHASVGVAPFVLDERTRAINPNKLYMYAAMDQNVVSTPFSDEVTAQSDLVYIADGAEAFTGCVKEALGDDERRRAMRERIAAPNSWRERALDFRALLEELAEPSH